jgi:anti-sigma factor ChrR (cupin superfamily)
MRPLSDLEELAAIDALGVLDQAEHRRYVARLAQASDEERTVVAEIYDTAAAMATATAPPAAPSPHVKDTLLARLSSHHRFFSIKATEGEWQPVMEGVSARLLSLDAVRDTAMLIVRLAAGVTYPAHHHSGAEDCYVLAGDVTIEGQLYGPGDFHHADAGSDHAPLSSEHGGEFLLVVAASDYIHAIS